MTLTQIEIFVELAHQKNFSKTADKLGITQSAVSHAIRKLEQELGLNLISRTRKQFQITETGANLLIYCQEIQRQMQNIEMEVAAQKNDTKATIRLGTVWSVANTILPKLLNTWKRKNPMTDVTILEGTDQEIEKWLLTSAIDVGICSCLNEQLHQVFLTQDRFYVVVSDRHPLAWSKSLQMTELEKSPFIMSKGGCEPFIRYIEKEEKSQLKVRFEAREILTIITMVKENMGISIIPELALPKGIDGVRFIPLQTDFRRKIYLGTLKSRNKTPLLKSFLEQIGDFF